MKGYILSIAGVILISAVIAIIAPGGKMGKFVKSMTRLFIFVVLITPFVRFVKDPNTALPSAEIALDEGYFKTYTAMLSRSEEEEIEAMLAEEYGISAEVTVARSQEDLSYKKIAVVVTDFGINGEEGHIDILSAVKERLSARYNCDVEVKGP